MSRPEQEPRVWRRRPAAFTLIEVMLALAVLSAALSSLLIARNRSIGQLRTADERVRLRAAASEALGREVLSTQFPESGSAGSTLQLADVVTSAKKSSEEYGESVLLHRLEVTARYRDRRNSPELTLVTAVLEVVPSEDDESSSQGEPRSPHRGPRNR